MDADDVTPQKRPQLSLNQDAMDKDEAGIFSPGIVTPGHSINSLFKDISNSKPEDSFSLSNLGAQRAKEPMNPGISQDAAGASACEQSPNPKGGCCRLPGYRPKVQK